MTVDKIEVYMRSCMKDMTTFASAASDMLISEQGRYFFSCAQPPAVPAAIKEWWTCMNMNGSYSFPGGRLGGSDWSMLDYADLHLSPDVMNMYVKDFRPEMALMARAYGTKYPQAIIGVFGVLPDGTGMCTVILKHQCFFQTLWLLYVMYFTEIVPSLCLINTFGRVFLSGNTGNLDPHKDIKFRFHGAGPFGLNDFMKQQILVDTSSTPYYVKTYDQKDALAISMRMSLPRRTYVRPSGIMSLFDII